MQWRWMGVWRNFNTFILPSHVGVRQICYSMNLLLTGMCKKMTKPLIFSSPLLSNFFTLSNEVNTWNVVSPILPTLILVSWSLEGTNLLSLVIYFVVLGSSTCGYSCGTSHICLFDVLVGHLLGDGPPYWHPLPQIFWCTFPTLSIVTRF